MQQPYSGQGQITPGGVLPAQPHHPAFVTQSTTTFELRISCKNLSDLDVLSKSDPMLILYTRWSTKEGWTEFGRTEWIKNNLDPQFVTPILIPWHFEANQYLRFLVVDIDKPSSLRVEDQDEIGFYETTLTQIVSGTSNGIVQVPLTKSPKNRSTESSCGTIKIVAEELNECRQEIDFQFALSQISLESTCGFKPSVYATFKLLRSSECGDPVVVYQSPVAKKYNGEYFWPSKNLKMALLCNGQPSRQLTILVFNDGKFLGSVATSASDLKDGLSLKLVNPKRSGKIIGVMTLKKYVVQQNWTFYDYLCGGHQIALSVGIDFTASNGHPSQPNSLHYTGPTPHGNPYLRAIRSVGSILEQYDTDKIIPAFAFGCKATFANLTQFSTLAVDPPSVYVNGVRGIEEAYNKAICVLPLSGPTLFAPLIQITCDEIDSKRSEWNREYFILLIITDGEINDMEATKKAIVRAANLPLSIIIVGVGNHDFANMVELDGDDMRLSASRDIVQFVPMRNFENVNYAAERLASEVLAEVPNQFIQFMRAHQILPNQANSTQQYVEPTYNVGGVVPTAPNPPM